MVKEEMKTCNVCKMLSDDVWEYEEIGKGNWVREDHSWFKKNNPICGECIKKYFKKYIKGSE
jgi:hypothetical protein